jgi:hypothetical protein
MRHSQCTQPANAVAESTGGKKRRSVAVLSPPCEITTPELGRNHTLEGKLATTSNLFFRSL